MNQTSNGWSERHHPDPMVSSAEEDDFSNFLEFGLDFSNFDPSTHDGQRIPEDSMAMMDSTMGHGDVAQGMKEMQHPQSLPTNIQHEQSQISAFHMPGSVVMDPTLQEQLIRQHQQFQQQQQHQDHGSQGHPLRPGPIIPPTPNSMGLHGEAVRYYQYIDPSGQVSCERQQRAKDDQMAFTPLVSPAVTPLEAQFSIPEYTVPGAYFSPLTSPALEAQNVSQHRTIYPSAPGSDSAATTSPIDPSIDLSTAANAPFARKPRRKPTATSRSNAKIVRQSPGMKPQTRRKQPPSATMSSEDISPIVEDSALDSQNALPPAKLRQPRSGTESSTESISPEPLADALMPPPAIPRSGSAGNSPFIQAQSFQSMGSEAQTPATLMRLQRQQKQPSLARPSAAVPSPPVPAQNDEVMEDISLPESATSLRSPLPPLDTSRANDGQHTPTLSAARTPTIPNFGTPITTASSSVVPSPQIRAVTSPGGSKRTDAKSTPGRGSKKRHTPSSSQVSPALRPKISPNIKPMISEGGSGSVSAETSAIYLATKSNYQNILEGTHLPGVSYPDALAENLTSKRTSHKIAEQGRRNRINTALKEIEALLPQNSSGKGADIKNGDKENGKGGRERNNGTSTNAPESEKPSPAQQGNSKASTVEMAIAYIKSLQEELAETKAKLEAAENKLAGGTSTETETGMEADAGAAEPHTTNGN